MDVRVTAETRDLGDAVWECAAFPGTSEHPKVALTGPSEVQVTAAFPEHYNTVMGTSWLPGEFAYDRNWG